MTANTYGEFITSQTLYEFISAQATILRGGYHYYQFINEDSEAQRWKRGELEPGFEPRKPGLETVSLTIQLCGLLTMSPQSGQHTLFLISGCFGASGTRSVKNSPILSNHFSLTAPLPTHPHCQAPSITSSYL